MKYLVFALMFVPLSALVGAAMALLFWSWPVGLVGAGFMLGLSADVCFNGIDKP